MRPALGRLRLSDNASRAPTPIGGRRCDWLVAEQRTGSNDKFEVAQVSIGKCRVSMGRHQNVYGSG
jgi:hypothetical protein